MDERTDAQLLIELCDRQSVRDVVADFCERVDRYDIDGLREVFTVGVTTDYGPGRGGPVAGRDAVLHRIAAGQAEFRRTHHQLGQSTIQVNGDLARATSYVTATHEDWEGNVSRVQLRYLDQLERTDAGWRITAREALVAVVEGMPAVTWNWVPRRKPSP